MEIFNFADLSTHTISYSVTHDFKPYLTTWSSFHTTMTGQQQLDQAN